MTFHSSQAKLFLVSYEIPNIYYMPSMPRYCALFLVMPLLTVFTFSQMFLAFFLLFKSFPFFKLNSNAVSSVTPLISKMQLSTFSCVPSVLFVVLFITSCLVLQLFIYTTYLSWVERAFRKSSCSRGARSGVLAC